MLYNEDVAVRRAYDLVTPDAAQANELNRSA